MVITLRLIVVILACLCCGCSSGISDKNLKYIMPNEAEILVQDGNSALLRGWGVAIVDSRQTWDFKDAHIEGSINIPFGWLGLLLGRLDDVGTIVVSGETYNDSVAIAMSKQLMKMGFTDVRTMRGGLVGWGDAGKPIETEE
jgi:rhodanese-related sulfurtransferase